MARRCIKKGKAVRLICKDFRGGKKGVRGQPGKKCVHQVRKRVTVCKDWSPKGHGKLTSEQRAKIKSSIKKGAFGKGAFSSLGTCKKTVDKQKRGGVPYALVSKRITLPTTVFRKNLPNGKKIIGKKCLDYARKVYGR